MLDRILALNKIVKDKQKANQRSPNLQHQAALQIIWSTFTDIASESQLGASLEYSIYVCMLALTD